MRAQTTPNDGERGEPTETSPLLAPQRNGSCENEPSDGSRKDLDAPATDGDEEAPGASSEDDAREVQFRGLPEAQKRLKYIVPAISLGVCNV